jgi:pyrroline-5-carboxylate reductase
LGDHTAAILKRFATATEMDTNNCGKSMTKQRIGFIGAGRMATALGRGFVAAGLVEGGDMLASDPSEPARRNFAEVTAGETVAENAPVVERSDVIFLAVKPPLIGTVAGQLKGKIGGGKLVVSIAAGVRMSDLADLLGSDVRLVRVMPNTPCLIGQGVCAYCLGEKATEDDKRLVGRLLDAVGVTYQVDERLMDAVTGLSGSGPAFVFCMIEALGDGGVRMGLPRDIANALAAQTVRGAADMVLQTGEHTAVLKDNVTSPGGTTMAGIQALEAGGLRAAVMAAVEAATKRSVELAEGK